MIKRILLSIVMLVLIAYLAVAITAFNRKPADQTCRDMELVIKDTAYAGFHQRRAERYPSAERDLPHREEDGTHLHQVTGTGTKQTSVD